jgi:hypothetical protein
MHVVTAIFKNRTDASEALMNLEAAGIRDDQISLVMTDQTRAAHFTLEPGNKVDEGVTAGATFGGIVGAVMGAVLTAGVITIPGLNLIITGALASGLAGLGAGATLGGIVGGLIGAGIPENEVKVYEKEIQQGNVLLAVHTETSEQKKRVKEILTALDAYSVAA